jgi:hypothetical protein
VYHADYYFRDLFHVNAMQKSAASIPIWFPVDKIIEYLKQLICNDLTWNAGGKTISLPAHTI